MTDAAKKAFEEWYSQFYAEWWKDRSGELEEIWLELSEDDVVDEKQIERTFTVIAQAIRDQYE